MGKFKDLTGQTIGRWQVLNIAFRKNGHIYYHCRCTCEKQTEKDVSACHLQTKRSLSCGCLRNEKTSNRQKIDITGQRFGKLIVLKEAGKTKDGHTTWLCQCDCGKQKIICGKSLRQGLTKSCGCTKSFGEETITKILIKNNIPFESEKSFDDCRYPDTNFQAKFDFWVNNEYLIEYDGKQHFGIGGWNDDENFKICKKHDEFKNNWVKNKGINLIRIPYTIKLKDITIDMLKPETSQFLI